MGYPFIEGDNKVLTPIPSKILKDFVGAKVVGMRIGLVEPIGASRGFIGALDANNVYNDIISDSISSTSKGWNTVIFSTPYTIASDKNLWIGFDYKQTNTGTDADRPLSFVDIGERMKTYFYANIPVSEGGRGLDWYNLSGAENLSVQLIVEPTTLPDKQILIHLHNISRSTYRRSHLEGEAEFFLHNYGTQTINNYTVDITLNDRLISTYQSTSALEPNSISAVYMPYTIPQDERRGKKELKFKFATIDGAAPAIAVEEKKDRIQIVDTLFKQNHLVEHYTGTAFNEAPLGFVTMEKATQSYSDKIVPIEIHNNNASDPMYSTNYIKRESDPSLDISVDRYIGIAPYYEITENVKNLFEDSLIVPFNITVKGEWNEDRTAVDAVATIEVGDDDQEEYNLAFALVADELKGEGAAWGQANKFANYTLSELSADDIYGVNAQNLAAYVKGGAYGQDPYYPTFRNVLIGSSYDDQGQHTTATITNLSADTPTEVSHRVALSAKQEVLDVLNRDKVKVVAYLLHKKYGSFLNVGYSWVKGFTNGIEDHAATSKDAKEIARYAIDGRRLQAPQKGINIVKYANGTTKKVVVK